MTAGGENNLETRRVASIHPIEGTATAEVPAVTSLAALLTRHVLHDGELVVLILKPSFWFIPLSALRFVATVAVLMIGAILLGDHLPAIHARAIWEAGVFVMAARLMWAIVQWSNRLYVLTDMRIVRISGIFNFDIFDCPLRKVARTRIISPVRERLCLVGSIEIIPSDPTLPVALWQTIGKPRKIHEIIVATINKAKQGCRQE